MKTIAKKPVTNVSRKRLNLDLSPEAYTLLRRLADATGKDMADVLRTGLALYGIAAEEEEKGRHLAIAEGETVKRMILMTP